MGEEIASACVKYVLCVGKCVYVSEGLQRVNWGGD